jgi:hypothetical protein
MEKNTYREKTRKQEAIEEHEETKNKKRIQKKRSLRSLPQYLFKSVSIMRLEFVIR